MIYKYQNKEIDLTKVKRLYPAALIELDGEMAEMSLEWIEMNEDKVHLHNYILVFDFTLPDEEQITKTVLKFQTKDELIKIMTEVAQFFNE